MNARYEKVDDKTLRFIVEKPTEITIEHLVENKKELLAKKEQINIALKNIEEMLIEARILGIEVKDDSNNN